MRNKEAERKLAQAVARLTPDVLDNILGQCGGPMGSVYVIKPKRPAKFWARAAGALAAAFILAAGGSFTYNWMVHHRLDTLITLDVNPSIAIEINRNDRVIGVEAKNEDAAVILDDMDLANTQIKVAVNALIGSMLKHGYIRENANSVLLSVEGANGAKNAVLQRDLTESISMQLNLLNGAVISQTLANDDAVQQLADEHRISYGKAALVQKIIAENSHLTFADLARLSVNELNLLISSKRIEAAGMASEGSASDQDYIGDETAKQTALSHAGIRESDAEIWQIELDYDDGAIIYDIEFVYNNKEYEYEINAKDGSIIEYNQKNKKDGQPRAPQSQGDFIGESQAAEIAQNHAGVTAYTDMKTELDKDDGLYIYEVEFYAEGGEYDYEINAATGEVISWEIDE